MELYNYFRSSASYRVRIALALKGLDYAYHSVHLAKNQQFTESYAAVSASRLVPTLQDGGVPLPVERTFMVPPRCRIGAISDEEGDYSLVGLPAGR